MNYMNTSDIARETGVHPNTVRKYETWGLLPPIPRNTSGYRLFTESHLDQMRLARMALLGEYPGRQIRTSGLTLVKQAARGDLYNALQSAYHCLALVRKERNKAETAVEILEQWALETPEDDFEPVPIRKAAELVEASVDMIRHWQRNGLIKVPQNPQNRYRLFGTTEIRQLKVIHMLSSAGYSTMAILRMMLQLEQGNTKALSQVLNTPGPDEDVYCAADHRLFSLDKWEQKFCDVITHLKEMIVKYRD